METVTGPCDLHHTLFFLGTRLVPFPPAGIRTNYLSTLT